MIKSITFKNFKALRDCTLPLGRFTLLVGPNGCGKSTALQALDVMARQGQWRVAEVRTAGVAEGEEVSVSFFFDAPLDRVTAVGLVQEGKASRDAYVTDGESVQPISKQVSDALIELVDFTRVYSLAADTIAAPVMLDPDMFLGSTGAGLAGVLDRLRDQHPERWDALNVQIGAWFSDFDRILFDTPRQGHRAIALRTCKGGHAIPASQLSQGTLLALAMLTLAYLPDPPPVVAFEEPDRGIHPRLLRDVRDAMYRLAYPESVDEDRPPVQVIATTHSPYMLDLFKDHPEEIVIAQKLEDNVRFDRLADLPHIEEILEGAPLGEVWYSGILGGAPAGK